MFTTGISIELGSQLEYREENIYLRCEKRHKTKMIIVIVENNYWFITLKDRTILIFLFFGLKWREKTRRDSYVWNLKYKIPTSNFVKAHLADGFSLTNLRPLWGTCPFVVEINSKFGSILNLRQNKSSNKNNNNKSLFLMKNIITKTKRIKNKTI